MREKLPLLMEVAVEPKNAADAEPLKAALERLAADSVRLGVTTDQESGQTILQGTGQDVLEEALAQIDVPFDVGAPQVAYREVLTKTVTISYTHKNMGPSWQFAKVEIDFVPAGQGSGFIFEDAVTDGSIPAPFIPAVRKGLLAQREFGVLAGFPLTDFKATLTGGAYHEVDSNERAFDIAARAALRELNKHDAVQIAEPMMKVAVLTPEEFFGGVVGDLNSRRGQVLETTGADLYQLVIAHVPLANMFGYQNTLDSMSQSRARHVMEFDHYEPVPDPRGGDDVFPGAMGMRVA